MSFPGIEPGTAHFSLRAYCELALSPHRPLWQVTWPHIIKSLAIIRKRVDAHNASATPDKRVELCLAEEVDDLNYLASIVCESWDPVSRVGVARRCFYCKVGTIQHWGAGRGAAAAVGGRLCLLTAQLTPTASPSPRPAHLHTRGQPITNHCCSASP